MIIQLESDEEELASDEEERLLREDQGELLSDPDEEVLPEVEEPPSDIEDQPSAGDAFEDLGFYIGGADSYPSSSITDVHTSSMVSSAIPDGSMVGVYIDSELAYVGSADTKRRILHTRPVPEGHIVVTVREMFDSAPDLGVDNFGEPHMRIGAFVPTDIRQVRVQERP